MAGPLLLALLPGPPEPVLLALLSGMTGPLLLALLPGPPEPVLLAPLPGIAGPLLLAPFPAESAFGALAPCGLDWRGELPDGARAIREAVSARDLLLPLSLSV